MTKKEILEQRQMLVVQSNDIVREAKNLLTAQEQNMLYYLISKIKPADTDFMTIHTTVGEVCEIFGISAVGDNYKDMKKALKALADKSVLAIHKNEKGQTSETLMRWLDTYTIHKDTGKMTATLSQSVKPFLIGLVKKGNYTQAELITYLGLKSKYAKRLYEILKSYIHMKYPFAYKLVTVKYELDELLRLLDAESYKAYKHVRERILDPAIAEITAVSDILVSYEPKKTGRKVTAIEFTTQCKEPYERIIAMSNASTTLNRQV